MLKSAVFALALLSAGAAIAAPPVTPASEPVAEKLLTVDTPMRDLIADPRTRAVIVQTMPGVAERMESEPEVAQIFGGVTITDMVADPHVRGLTPEVLAKLNARLIAAQAPSATP